jgi:hypothetical protein
MSRTGVLSLNYSQPGDDFSASKVYFQGTHIPDTKSTILKHIELLQKSINVLQLFHDSITDEENKTIQTTSDKDEIFVSAEQNTIIKLVDLGFVCPYEIYNFKPEINFCLDGSDAKCVVDDCRLFGLSSASDGPSEINFCLNSSDPNDSDKLPSISISDKELRERNNLGATLRPDDYELYPYMQQKY